MNNHTDKSSNQIWENAANFKDFETSRPLLFRDDMREQFFRWFRIKPSDKVLDGGCATGVLTRFIAKGLDTGSITGFDAVINHTYLGVLSDITAGLKELIRVCRPGGHIAASCSGRRGFTRVHWAGDSSFAGEARLNELVDKREGVHQKVYTAATLKQNDYWTIMRYPRLFAKCGLKNITLHPYASGFSYNDSYWTDEFKEYKIKAGIGREIEMLEEQRKNPQFIEHGFTQEDFDELIALYRQKQEYLLSSMHDDDCWEWDANMHLIVSGTKV